MTLTHLLQVSLVYVSTLMIQQVVAEPEPQNHLTDADLRALSGFATLGPNGQFMCLYANINPYGKYRFNVEGEFHRKGLRPLRQPDSALA